MKKYVVGFLFNQNASKVVLIKKINPAWQNGYFNGVGGKVEKDEQPVDAMSREFLEETGVLIPVNEWTMYANVYRPAQYDMDVFFAHSDNAYQVQTIEKEEVNIFPVEALPTKLIPNLKWLIPLALDEQADFSQTVSILENPSERIKA